MLACKMRHTEIAATFLRSGAIVNHRNKVQREANSLRSELEYFTLLRLVLVSGIIPCSFSIK